MSKKSQPIQKRCVIYTRRAAACRDRSSLKEQEKICLFAIEAHESDGWIFTGKIYEDDGVSGIKRDRPGLNSLVEDARNQSFECVIFSSIDKLSRDFLQYQSVIAELQSYGVDTFIAEQSKNTEAA